MPLPRFLQLPQFCPFILKVLFKGRVQFGSVGDIGGEFLSSAFESESFAFVVGVFGGDADEFWVDAFGRVFVVAGWTH